MKNLIKNLTAVAAQKLQTLCNHLAIICDDYFPNLPIYGVTRMPITLISANLDKAVKKTSLYEPFTITTTDRHIVLSGPFLATKNNAQILEYLLSSENRLSIILKDGDIFILD